MHGTLASYCTLFAPNLIVLFLLAFDDRWDYLKISDGRNHMNGSYCGNQTGKRVFVDGRTAELTFHTDYSVRYRGFYASLYFSPRSRGEFSDVSIL